MYIKDKKAVIFDMDGVIVDTEMIWKHAEKEVFSSLGVLVNDEGSAKTQSMTTAEATQFWYKKFPWKGVNLKEVERMVISKVIELIETEACAIKGVKSFIEQLKYRNYKIGLATNSPSIIIPVVLNKLDVTHLFDAVSSAEFEDNGKPAPAIYYTIAKKLAVKPEDCFVIEDTYSGMTAAKNAGMTVIAFTNGNKKLHFKIADYKIDSFEKKEIK
ncbi:HAD family hydrolase [Mesoflavibacter zeaxanthinifaciens]|uniref:HAD family hydrolase n=1 Tax=Mesoflavibacter zeaxanthinifaciens TaxID=393060 RepID=UPI003A947AF1